MNLLGSGCFLTRPVPDVRFSFPREESWERRLSRPGKKRSPVDLSRRKFLLRYGQGASLAFLPAGLGIPSFRSFFPQASQLPQSEFHVSPQYRTRRDIEPVLRKVQAGLDEFVTEKYHDQVAAV